MVISCFFCFYCLLTPLCGWLVFRTNLFGLKSLDRYVMFGHNLYHTLPYVLGAVYVGQVSLGVGLLVHDWFPNHFTHETQDPEQMLDLPSPELDHPLVSSTDVSKMLSTSSDLEIDKKLVDEKLFIKEKEVLNMDRKPRLYAPLEDVVSNSQFKIMEDSSEELFPKHVELKFIKSDPGVKSNPVIVDPRLSQSVSGISKIDSYFGVYLDLDIKGRYSIYDFLNMYKLGDIIRVDGQKYKLDGVLETRQTSQTSSFNVYLCNKFPAEMMLNPIKMDITNCGMFHDIKNEFVSLDLVLYKGKLCELHKTPNILQPYNTFICFEIDALASAIKQSYCGIFFNLNSEGQCFIYDFLNKYNVGDKILVQGQQYLLDKVLSTSQNRNCTVYLGDKVLDYIVPTSSKTVITTPSLNLSNYTINDYVCIDGKHYIVAVQNFHYVLVELGNSVIIPEYNTARLYVDRHMLDESLNFKEDFYRSFRGFFQDTKNRFVDGNLVLHKGKLCELYKTYRNLQPFNTFMCFEVEALSSPIKQNRYCANDIVFNGFCRLSGVKIDLVDVATGNFNIFDSKNYFKPNQTLLREGIIYELLDPKSYYNGIAFTATPKADLIEGSLLTGDSSPLDPEDKDLYCNSKGVVYRKF